MTDVIDFAGRRKQAVARLQMQIDEMKAVLGALPSGSVHYEKIALLLKKLRLKAARLSIPVRVRAVSAEKRKRFH